MNEKIYIVNFKETTINENNVMEVNSGTNPVAYKREADAIQQCWNLSDDKMNEFIPSAHQTADWCDDNDELYRDSDSSETYICVHYHNDTYEFWVTEVKVQ